jgi:PAS domain S-box-containing protein
MGRVFDFIANSDDGVFAVDHLQSIVLWNERATRILGFSAEEVLGKKCYEVVCGRDDRGCVVCRRGCEAITAAKQLWPAPTRDIEVRTKGGPEAWLSLSTVVVPSSRGDLWVLVHLFREVTRERDLPDVAQDLAGMVASRSRLKLSPRSHDASHVVASVELKPLEREILIHLSSGVSTNFIAEKLSISPHGVRDHVSSILGKLDVHSRLEALAYSIKNGLV